MKINIQQSSPRIEAQAISHHPDYERGPHLAGREPDEGLRARLEALVVAQHRLGHREPPRAEPRSAPLTGPPRRGLRHKIDLAVLGGLPVRQ